MKLKFITVLAIALFTGSVLNAQKFGYINSAAILAEMPDVKEAESNLETLQKQLQARGEKMLQDFQVKYAELERRHSEGGIAPKDLEREAQKLQEEENKIVQFEQEMQRILLQKREELLQPILDKVNRAIKAVAEEGSYAYIFDASTGVLLYADENTDVTAKVRAKLAVM